MKTVKSVFLTSPGLQNVKDVLMQFVIFTSRNKLRQTRSAALLGIDDNSSSRNAFIGKQGKDFEFSHVNPIHVQFCECNLKNEQVEGEVNLDNVRTWLEAL